MQTFSIQESEQFPIQTRILGLTKQRKDLPLIYTFQREPKKRNYNYKSPHKKKISTIVNFGLPQEFKGDKKKIRRIHQLDIIGTKAYLVNARKTPSKPI